ncbi:TonB-dependent receptor domain-containing protein [Bdellovibrio sp. HCB209]|uniref:TonB-dependent receptor domain-containing protein n=1 Tax=Bdellovibrio sp. HCB209 TaxID=3394354 RepID=UPI0039B38107
MRSRVVATLGSVLLISNSVLAQESIPLPQVSVEARAIEAHKEERTSAEITSKPYRDASEAIESFSGVGHSRIGGHGSDLFIRGLQQNNINITSGGNYHYGGCSSRMDPPTAYLQLGDNDTIELTRGYKTVEYGFGGVAGSVAVTRDYFTERMNGYGVNGKVSAGYESNGNLRFGGASAKGSVLSDGSLMADLSGNWKESDNYESGNGQEVRSAFKDQQYSYGAIWFPSEKSVVVAKLEQTYIRDAKFEGAMMDSPVSDNQAVSIITKMKNLAPAIDDLKFNVFSSKVNHLMDNYTLKSTTPMMFMKSEVESKTDGAKFVAKTSGSPIMYGAEWLRNSRLSENYSGMSIAGMTKSVLPEPTMDNYALFAEAPLAIAERQTVVLGLRGEQVNNSLDGAGNSLGMITAEQLYRNTYSGVGDLEPTDYHLNFVARYEYKTESQAVAFVNLAQNMRSGDAIERYMAANSMTASQKWIGNPGLKPEQHQIVEVGMFKPGSTSWSGSVFYDHINDFIFRDTAKGQSGVTANSGESIYRNIPAELLGAEIQGSHKIESWTLSGSINYVYGENRDKNIPLPQMPPLFGDLSATYGWSSWEFGATARFAADQNRVDMDSSVGSGRDVQKTPGWATLDLNSQYKFKSFLMNFGVKNLFNKDHSMHMNRSDSVTPAEVQVKEPGRSFYLQANMTF